MATEDGTTNTDYRWKTEKGQLLESGRLQQGVNARVRAQVKLWMECSLLPEEKM